MKKYGMILYWLLLLGFLLLFMFGLDTALSHAANPKSKFYDFSEQLIDGQIKKPTTLYTDSREQVKFDRLLKMKKTFIPNLLNTAKERVF